MEYYIIIQQHLSVTEDGDYEVPFASLLGLSVCITGLGTLGTLGGDAQI